MPAAILGVPPPPASLYLRALPGVLGPSFVGLHHAPDRVPDLSLWLASLAGSRSRVHALEGLPAFRVDLEKLPGRLAALAGEARVEEIEVHRDGRLVASFDGTRDDLRGVAYRARQEGERPLFTAAPLPAGGRPLLTARQSQALSTAVAHGYYRIPRIINLRALARILGVTHATVSELLRRAEARVITAYIESGTREDGPDGPP